MRLQLFAAFHLNLAYSSIEEEQRADVIQKCYWPLLKLAAARSLPFGIEATGYTLEAIEAIDPAFIAELRRLVSDGPCELIGSGYAQLIGPLVPSAVNAANFRLGNEVYRRLFGFAPTIALVNEQAYSAGMVSRFLEAGYRAIIMEWDNAAQCHPEWAPETRYLPQYAEGVGTEAIAVLWNQSIAFQKIQRVVHGEIDLADCIKYLERHVSNSPRVFSIYGNDIEIFDFRPGRYHTEAALEDREWPRMESTFRALQEDGRFELVTPSRALDLLKAAGGGARLHLESAATPVPVKKQMKYNVTRWAVTGLDDLGSNTACWRIYEALRRRGSTSDEEWRELCYLWSSDFRTHITARRWSAFRERLAQATPPAPAAPARRTEPVPADFRVDEERGYLTVETDLVRARLNPRRGLAVDQLWIKGAGEPWLCGTLHHGYFDDIRWGADFYTGNLAFEAPGTPQVTDLGAVKPVVEFDSESGALIVAGTVETRLGPVHKEVRLSRELAGLQTHYRIEWPKQPVGVLRLGNVLLNPEAFERKSLRFLTHNGGDSFEEFSLAERDVFHGEPVSFRVSAQVALGVTDGVVEIGDARRRLIVEIDKTRAAAIGMVTCQSVDDKYFCRLGFSLREFDETCRGEYQNFDSAQGLSFALTIRSKGTLK